MSFAIDVIIRSSLVLLAGFLAAAALRRQPAALRHWVLAAALALAAAQPLMNRVIPALQVPAIGWTNAHIASEPGVETSFRVDVPDPAPAPPAPAVTDWTRTVLVVWAAGAAISLAVLLSGALWLTWLGSRSAAADDRWSDAASAVRSQLGVRRPVRVLITRHPALLVTWGVMAPVILLPGDAGSWPADRMRLVLAHEMAHLVRRDWMIQLAAEVVRAINWFNPLFWLACATLRRESEYACDDIVLDLGIGGTSYASHLVDLARTFSVHGRTWLPAPSIARPSTLERRVRAMLNPHLDRRPVSLIRRFALAALMLAIALPIAAASQAPSTPSGTVADPHGKPLPDATVRLTAISGGQVFETRTNDAGSFQFPDIPAGEYMLSVRALGFSGQRQRLLLSGGGTTIALQVRVGTLRERVTVGAGTGASDPGPVSTSRYERSECTPSTGGQIIPPMKVRDVRPIYKKELIDNRVEGEILLHARIEPDGKVRSVDVISPVNADLEDAAMTAVSQWEFTPTYLNCEPIEVQMYVTVAFKVDR